MDRSYELQPLQLQPEIPDIDEGELKRLTKSSDYCQTYLCYAKNPLPAGPAYSSIDLRESHVVTRSRYQGSCGCCYQFAAVAGYEALVLHERKALRQDPRLNAFWNVGHEQLSISEQYAMQNDFGFNNYCEGGNAVLNANWLHVSGLSLETNAHYPFKEAGYVQGKPSQYQQTWANERKKTAGFKFSPKHADTPTYLPFAVYPNVYYRSTMRPEEKEVPSILLYSSSSVPFPAATISTIKQYISRGFPVQFSMYAPQSDEPTYQTLFNNQPAGTVIKTGSKYAYTCTKTSMNHAILAIGYGKKDGANVWVVKNSWGKDWGSAGVFFVEIGKNFYCTEFSAYTFISKSYTEGLFQRATPSARAGTSYLDAEASPCAAKTPYYFYENLVLTCAEKCPSTAPYAEPDGLCQQTCSFGSFEVRSGASQTLFCVESCPAKYVQQGDGQWRCAAKCSGGTEDPDGSGTCRLSAGLPPAASFFIALLAILGLSGVILFSIWADAKRKAAKRPAEKNAPQPAGPKKPAKAAEKAARAATTFV